MVDTLREQVTSLSEENEFLRSVGFFTGYLTAKGG